MAATATIEREAEVDGFSKEEVSKWRRQVMEQRDLLFRRNWKNMHQVLALRSREEEAAFQYVLEWYDEFGDVVGRQKQRDRFDKLIAMGLDVNAPNEDVRL